MCHIQDGWYHGGYTGNFVGAVWMGNDDYTSTKRMTGGTLPAMTWHNIMTYAHQGVELRQLPGLPPPQHAPVVAEGSFKGADEAHPVLLTRKATEALVHLEETLDDADRALAKRPSPPARLGALDTSNDSNGNGGAGRLDAITAIADQKSPAASRGD